MSRPLSDDMKRGLLGLLHGWRFGIDRRTERGLRNRGLIWIESWTSIGGHQWETPALTEDGRKVAIALKAEAYEVFRRENAAFKLTLVQGGEAA